RVAAEGLSQAGTFTSASGAEAAVGRALNGLEGPIGDWLKTASPGAQRGFTFVDNQVTGRVASAGQSQVRNATRTRVVLRAGDDGTFTLRNAYPQLPQQ